uniref:hypothetical protein n=1 Tax=Streptomyces sp. TG1A-60 TaxID=3129111 RepID=UPI00403FE94C
MPPGGAGEVAGLGGGQVGRAGRADEAGEDAEKASGRVDPKAGGADAQTADGADAADDAARSSRPGPGLGPATATRCGPELASPDGIEAQTCVLTQGEETWARTYYRNTAGRELGSVLGMMAPGGRTVRTHCASGPRGEPGCARRPGGVRGAGRGRTRRWRSSRRLTAPGRCFCARGATPPGRKGVDGEEGSVQRRGPEPGHEKTRLLATGDAPATGLMEP